MRARVTVTLKTGILDPQGKAIEGALKSLGVPGIASVRQGKVFDVELDAADAAEANAALRDACERLLANTVIENFHVDLAASDIRPEPVADAADDAFAPDESVPSTQDEAS
jgi:phosphoribosylformylglycinamidine synthase PurS subunit